MRNFINLLAVSFILPKLCMANLFGSKFFSPINFVDPPPVVDLSKILDSFENVPPMGLYAEGHDRRIDLIWDRVSQTDQDHFNIYRAEHPDGPWLKLNAYPHSIHVYSDYTGVNDQRFYYRVTRCFENARRDQAKEAWFSIESQGSTVTSAVSIECDDELLLTSIQKACFRYFWHFGHPVSGLAREGYLRHRDTTTTGGTGFGMLTILVGVERGFVKREQAALRLLKMVTFLGEKAERYHGIWAHHLRGDTGETIPFDGKLDNGGDVVESAFLMQGMLTVREYFDRYNEVEVELRQRITKLWLEAEWSWYLQPNTTSLTWHWSPDYGFEKNHRFNGFNECMIAYLLAMASPTYPIHVDHYYSGWVNDANNYVNGSTYYGIKQPVGAAMGGPLFFTHYSFLALDPSKVNDLYTNYYENNRAISLIHHRYAIDNPNGHHGYSDLVWGLTSSYNRNGYKAHEPGVGQHSRDDGTITPTAALCAMPYTPEESIATLKHFYFDLGPDIWGPFGFYDAFNISQEWISPGFLAIDQGPIAPMIENHRTGLLWKVFMRSEVGVRIIQKIRIARPVVE